MVESVQHLGKKDVYTILHPDQVPPCHGIWHLASHIYEVDGEGEVKVLEAQYVGSPYFPEGGRHVRETREPHIMNGILGDSLFGIP